MDTKSKVIGVVLVWLQSVCLVFVAIGTWWPTWGCNWMDLVIIAVLCLAIVVISAIWIEWLFFGLFGVVFAGGVIFLGAVAVMYYQDTHPQPVVTTVVPTKTPMPTATSTATPLPTRTPTPMPTITPCPVCPACSTNQPTPTPIPTVAGEVNCYAVKVTEDVNPPLGSLVVIQACTGEDFYRVDWYPKENEYPYSRIIGIDDQAGFVSGERSISISVQQEDEKIKIIYK